MTKEDVINVIIKEFPFIKFEFFKSNFILYRRFYEGYIYSVDAIDIVLGNEYICIYHKCGNNFIGDAIIWYNEGKILEKMYKYLPKEFYLPYFREDKINDILNGTDN